MGDGEDALGLQACQQGSFPLLRRRRGQGPLVGQGARLLRRVLRVSAPTPGTCVVGLCTL